MLLQTDVKKFKTK